MEQLECWRLKYLERRALPLSTTQGVNLLSRLSSSARWPGWREARLKNCCGANGKSNEIPDNGACRRRRMSIVPLRDDNEEGNHSC